MKKTSMIERYLDQSMEAEERAAFVKKMAEDDELKRDIQLHEEINTAILENDVYYFRESVKSLLKHEKKNSPKLRVSWIKYPIAAGIIVLIAVSVWQIISTKSPEDLYLGFYQPYQSDLSIRSTKKSTDKIQLAYLLYEQGDYETSYEILDNYLKSNYNNQTARFYLGMNAFELGQLDNAIQELTLVESDPSTPFALHARWYLAMLYLKKDQPDKASQYLGLLAESENMYTEQAKEILEKL